MNVRHVYQWCVVSTLLALGLGFGLNKWYPHRRQHLRRQSRQMPSKGCKCSRVGRFTRHSPKP